MFIAFLAIFLTFILVIGVHELGHALVARLAGVSVIRVSIGFGRPLIQWKSKNGCEWVWSIWPLGGYVRLLNSRISPVPKEQLPFCFDKKPLSVRAGILLAGAAANLLTAWIGFSLVFFIGLKYQPPLIEAIAHNSPAYQAGLQAGQQIVAIGGKATDTFTDVGMRLIQFWGNSQVKITVKSTDGLMVTKELDLSKIQFAADNKNLLSSLGITPNVQAPIQIKQVPTVTAAIYQGVLWVIKVSYFFLIILKQLVSGILPFSLLLGPIGFFVSSIDSFTQGLTVYLYFISSLSVALALINLSPIPGLDGGSILYIIIEKIRRKPLSVAAEVLVYRLIFIVFCVLLVQLLMNDLMRYLKPH